MLSKIHRRTKRIKDLVLYMIKNRNGKKSAAAMNVSKPIWLFSERGNDARDNGYWMFKYVTEHHPEISAYYVIDRKSADYDKVAALGKTVQPGSALHYALMYAAEALISTHDSGYTPDMVLYHHMYNYGLFKPKGKRIFLQHGIMDKDVSWYYRKNFKPDMFVVSNTAERDIILKYFNQPEKNIMMTGLPRYDTLSNMFQRNMILVMPTWRQYLVTCSEEEFRQSEYFKFYDSLLHSGVIAGILDRYGYDMIFYPHIEMQRFHAFSSDNPRITVADFENYDVQALLKQASILVTDYSSVYFDVAYMEKDIVFAHFDRSDYEGRHYNACLLDYDQFGTVTKTLQETESAIEEALINPGRKQEEQNEFFYYHDSENCRRVYEAIRDVIRE